MKRKYNGGNTRFRKRPRFSRRRFNGRRKRSGGRFKTNNFTSLSTRPRSNIRVGGRRKGSRKAWNRKLRNITDVGTHHKATHVMGTFTYATPAALGQQAIAAVSVLDEANPFWTAGGGLQPDSFGLGVPTFGTDTYVIRGGKAYYTFSNPIANSCVVIRIQVIYPKQQVMQAASHVTTNVPLFDYFTAITAGTTVLHTPIQDFADYSEYFHPPVMDQECLLQAGETVQWEYKLPIKKVNADAFQRGASFYPYWFIYLGNTLGGVSNTVTGIQTYDLSFASMAT